MLWMGLAGYDFPLVTERRDTLITERKTLFGSRWYCRTVMLLGYEDLADFVA